jgi:hypothetical protein
MTEGAFPYEDDLLKHYVRTMAWLPLCRNRLDHVRKVCRPKAPRKLKYFTFAAVGAVDVLMLDVAGIVQPSMQGFFDTVYFFDKTNELVAETRKRIPGAVGFPYDFVKLILEDDPEEDSVVDGLSALDAPTDAPNEFAIRDRQALMGQRRQFIHCFPFDIVNLDLQDFLFKPSDPLPGKLVNAFRRVFGWQRRRLSFQPGGTGLDGFSLMFTTQIGPKNIGEDYLNMLRDRLDANIRNSEDLRGVLIERTGCVDAATLQNTDFDAFFKLAVPKVLANILLEEDWHIRSEPGIDIYEFERPSSSGPYKILHLVMDVQRNNPPREHRPPGDECEIAKEAYRKVVHGIFTQKEVVVTPELAGTRVLVPSLEEIKARRREYCPDDDSIC